LSLLRSLGLSPSRITRYNARHMLRSLVEVLCQGGYTGLVVLVDDVETLLGRSSESQLRYTKMRREDTYESIRQLIDEIDSLRNIFFVFGFDRGLFDDERAGIKSGCGFRMRLSVPASTVLRMWWIWTGWRDSSVRPRPWFLCQRA